MSMIDQQDIHLSSENYKDIDYNRNLDLPSRTNRMFEKSKYTLHYFVWLVWVTNWNYNFLLRVSIIIQIT
jgi:hypothetical protein